MHRARGAGEEAARSLPHRRLAATSTSLGRRSRGSDRHMRGDPPRHGPLRTPRAGLRALSPSLTAPTSSRSDAEALRARAPRSYVLSSTTHPEAGEERRRCASASPYRRERPRSSSSADGPILGRTRGSPSRQGLDELTRRSETRATAATAQGSRAHAASGADPASAERAQATASRVRDRQSQPYDARAGDALVPRPLERFPRRTRSGSSSPSS